MRPRVLDLFCGAGGVARGFQRAGFYVVGVDIKPQPRYAGDEFVQGDALEVLRTLLAGGATAGYRLEDFAAIHASPPCQAHTAMRTMPNAREHENLIPQTRALLLATGLPFVIENVVGARGELNHPVEICGAAVGLRTDTHDLARHRLFECSFPVMVPPCAHGARPIVGIYGDHVRDRRPVPGAANPDRGRQMPDGERLRWGREAMGIDWMEWAELTQAIPPAYTEHIGQYLMAELRAMPTTDPPLSPRVGNRAVAVSEGDRRANETIRLKGGW